MRIIAVFIVGVAGIMAPLFMFAQRPSVADLELQLVQEQAKYAARMERVGKLENAHLQSAVIVDPTAKDFAQLPSAARLRVKGPFGTDFGTGSVILSDEGRALIITVSHIFRNADEKSVISAEIFNPKTGKVETFFVGYDGIKKTDPKADVGLLLIPTNRVISTLPLASINDVLVVGQKVVSYGCGGGEPPSKLEHLITIFNRYVGSDTIECTGVPLQGRSGGALVDGNGRMIGITIAADQRDQRGLYAGLAPIRAILESVGIDPRTLEKPLTVK